MLPAPALPIGIPSEGIIKEEVVTKEGGKYEVVKEGTEIVGSYHPAMVATLSSPQSEPIKKHRARPGAGERP
jgi:hypothetical protein